MAMASKRFQSRLGERNAWERFNRCYADASVLDRATLAEAAVAQRAGRNKERAANVALCRFELGTFRDRLRQSAGKEGAPRVSEIKSER